MVARIQQCSGTLTDSIILLYWSGQFFGTRTDSTFCRYSPGFNNVPVLTHILPFFRTGTDSFSVLARIEPFAGTSLDSNRVPVLTLIQPFFRIGLDSFSELARIPSFAGTRPD